MNYTCNSQRPEVRAKLKLSADRLRREREEEKKTYVYIDLSSENLSIAKQQVHDAYNKGYFSYLKLNNLILNKIRKEYPILNEVCKTMMYLDSTKRFSECLYMLYHNLSERPHCSLHLDNKCTDKVSFVSFNIGYNEACGQCSKHKPNSAKKLSDTYFKRTGFRNPAQNPLCMKKRGDNIELKRGKGIRHHMQDKEYKKKFDENIEKQFGVKNIMFLKKFIKKRSEKLIDHFGKEPYKEITKLVRSSMLKNHGIPYFTLSDKLKEKVIDFYHTDPDLKQKRINCAKELEELYLLKLDRIPELFHENIGYTCLKCGHKGMMNLTSFYSGHTWICPICHPYAGNHSKSEYDIMNMIKHKLPYEKCIMGDKSILNGKEIDLYYSDRNIGIEFCGLRYHSSDIIISNDVQHSLSEDYHYNKWKMCKDKGIDLITIFEDEWCTIHPRKITLAKLYKKFDIFDHEINSEDCVIFKIDDTRFINEFISKNETNVYEHYENCFSLMYNNGKVPVSVLLYKRNNDNSVTIRYIESINYKVKNGFQHLLYHLYMFNDIDKLYYNVDRCWNLNYDLEKFDFKKEDDYLNHRKLYWGSGLPRKKIKKQFSQKNEKSLLDGKLHYVFDCGDSYYSK